MTPSKEKLGFVGAWSMAVGRMVGGGIFLVWFKLIVLTEFTGWFKNTSL